MVGKLRRSALSCILALLAAWAGGGDPGAAVAAPPPLEFPAACTPGQDCWVFQYFDHDPGPGSRDYTCGGRSYNEHNGTDIALQDGAAIDRNVAVLAAAAGVVRNIRDGVEDRLFEPKDRAGLKGRECGNGVVITHEDGWETQYCHLRKGSVRVRPGQAVAAGEALGSIGLSGMTQFPHVHLSVRHNGKPIDPFVGAGSPEACSLARENLWSAAAVARMQYSPVDILSTGLAGDRPSPDDAYSGRLRRDRLPADSPVLIGWTVIGAVRNGDRLSLRVLAPDGSTIAEQQSTLERDQIRYFAYAGRKRRGPSWAAGRYRTVVRLERSADGQKIVREAEASVTVR